MGIKAQEALNVDFDGLVDHLRTQHSAYAVIGEDTYYLTDCNSHYWRVQRTDELNEKGHYVDASELVPTVSEFVELPFKDDKSIKDLFEDAEFFASVKE